jgi:hypothetical protein
VGSSSSGSSVEWSGVRRRRLVQIGGRAGRAEGEMGGGRLGPATQRREKERKRGWGAWGRQRMLTSEAGLRIGEGGGARLTWRD